MQVCTSLQTNNHASTTPLSFFTGRMPFLPPNQQHQSTEGMRYDPKTHEKHPVHGTPYLTRDESPVSEGEEHHAKNEDEIDESLKSQLKF